MITPRQYAEIHSVAYTTVVGWLRLELIEGASKVELPHMKSHVYMIPKDAKPPELKPGPKPKPGPNEANGEQDAAPAEKAKPAVKMTTATKATKKAGSKKTAKKSNQKGKATNE